LSALPPVSPIDDLVPGDLAQAAAAGGTTPVGPSFAKMMAEGIAEVDAKLKAGEAGLQQLATGDVQNLHQVMIRLEESRLSFQLAMQVRNRLLEAYQDIMKMQV
jgi:flagellar hook-basal body complex protein FliE